MDQLLYGYFIPDDTFVSVILLRSVPEIPFLNSVFFFIYLIYCFCCWIINPGFLCRSGNRKSLFIDETDEFFATLIGDLSVSFTHRLQLCCSYKEALLGWPNKIQL